ncbi:RNA polymerase sigma factor [Neolewinella persica]|uniref:RNA polymerase sigma factor n=1 Tax=Neolewinella persica TaxID=70998 RepID=UPI000381EC6E|nr:RNA polymerase sigma factor [Neolewinella persica]
MTNQEFTLRTKELNNLLFAFALRLTRSRQDAEDLMQETAIRAYKYRHNFTKGTNFKSWISTIMRNTFINIYRKNKTRRHLNHTSDEITDNVEVKNIVANSGEQNLRVEEMTRMLNSMGDIYAIPFLMFYKGYEYQEIATQLNIPIGTVKSRIFSARVKMKQMLGERAAA